jgi:hypothetical protein
MVAPSYVGPLGRLVEAGMVMDGCTPRIRIVFLLCDRRVCLCCRLVGADSSAPLSPLFLTAAGMTGAVEAIVYTPVDLVKVRGHPQTITSCPAANDSQVWEGRGWGFRCPEAILS